MTNDYFERVLAACRDGRRLGALRSYAVLDTPSESGFDAITKLLASICETPIAIVSFIDEQRQWFKAEIGLGIRETSLDRSMCAYALLEDDLLIVPDASKDPRFMHNPAVAGVGGVRFYAGSPIRTKDGIVLGTLSVVDMAPRTLTATQELALRTLSHQVMMQLELRRTIACLEKSEGLFGAAFDQSIVGMVVSDLGGRIIKANEAFCRLVDRSQDELVGRDSSGYTHRDDIAANTEKVRQIESQEFASAIFEKRYVRKDGTVVAANVFLSPVRDSESNLTGLIAVVEDVTEQREAEEGRERLLESERTARSEVERVSRMKDEFLATLSHELRTPLNAILGWSQFLQRGVKSEQRLKEGMDAIERNARAQTGLIEDLLDMSRIVSGKLRLDVQDVNLPDVLEGALDAVMPAARAKNIEIDRIFDMELGSVLGDAARLQQVIWNLLTNAVKFTPSGGKIRLTLEKVDTLAEISVADTGNGISEQFIPYVFERFRQADASTTRRYGGLGLGLSLVKQLAELHGGSVRAVSPGEGQGATFTVSLPISRMPIASGESVFSRGDSGDRFMRLDGASILVIDDEPDARLLLQNVLSEVGAKTQCCASVAEGIASIQNEWPDVVISDIGMPGDDGYSFIRQLRSLEQSRSTQTPAVALTAFAREEDKSKALDAGFQAHITKPVEPSELIAVVAGFLEKAERE